MPRQRENQRLNDQTRIVREWLDGHPDIEERARAEGLDVAGLHAQLVSYLFPVKLSRRGPLGHLIWCALNLVDWDEIHESVYGRH